MAQQGRRILLSIFWIILLLFLVWPIASFVCGIWIFLQPFEAFFEPIISINRFLERLVLWPRSLGQAILNGTEDFPQP